LGVLPGHPVVFDPAAAVAAAQLATGDEGARSYLAQHRDRVRRLDCTTLADAGDVDTVDDLRRLEP
jgi:nicotine blue oxidoreductase